MGTEGLPFPITEHPKPVTICAMGRITAIEAQKRRGDRMSVFVDGEFVVGAHEEVILALGLAVGQAFENEQLLALVRAETLRKARESALRLLSYRSRSVTEIRRKLVGNNFPEEVVDEVVEQLSRTGLLDDEKFSRDWVKSRTTSSRPMGRTRLAWELRSKGVEPTMVDEALEDVDEDTEYAMALSLASRKMAKSDRNDPSIRNRLSSFLRRRGFSWEITGKVIQELCPDEQD